MGVSGFVLALLYKQCNRFPLEQYPRILQRTMFSHVLYRILKYTFTFMSYKHSVVTFTFALNNVHSYFHHLPQTTLGGASWKKPSWQWRKEQKPWYQISKPWCWDDAIIFDYVSFPRCGEHRKLGQSSNASASGLQPQDKTFKVVFWWGPVDFDVPATPLLKMFEL